MQGWSIKSHFMWMTCYYSFRSPLRVFLIWWPYLQILAKYRATESIFRRVSWCLFVMGLIKLFYVHSLLRLVVRNKYLDVWVTHNHKDLYLANFQSLLSKQDIGRRDPVPIFRWKDKDECSTQIFICISVSPSLFNKVLLLQIKKSGTKKHPELKELCCRDLALWEGWHFQTSCIIIGQPTCDHCYTGWGMMLQPSYGQLWKERPFGPPP